VHRDPDFPFSGPLERLSPLDGDKSSAESADKSAHSKACGWGASRVRLVRTQTNSPNRLG